MWIMLGALGVVDESGEDDNTEDEEEDEKSEFVSAGLERLYEDLVRVCMRILSPGEWRVSLNSRIIRIILKNTHATA